MWTRNDDAQGGGSASLTYADGMLYVRYQNGWVSLVIRSESLQAGQQLPRPEWLRQLLGPSVVVGGKLYIREREVIWCYDVKKK